MEASSITRRVLACADFRTWAWWQLPWRLRSYVGLVPVTAFALIGYAASQTTWHAGELVKFLLLLGCGLISVAATPRIAYTQGALVRDFITVWVLPIAILLPPVYAMVAPIPLLAMTQWVIHRGVVHRRVFTACAMGLAYGAASLVFRAFPASLAGSSLGRGSHVLTWTLVVAICEILGGRGHNALIVLAVKISDPTIRLADQELSREALQADFAEFDLGVLITVVVAVNPVLAVFAVPSVLLARRFIMHAQLLAQSRIDTKTGLLNASTWEREATVEIARAVRTGSPLALALVDIDHFKLVNDTYGHLAGDKALRAVTDALRGQLRSYDLAGRFGGEEFVILLPQTREYDALGVAERLRSHIAAMSIPVDGDEAGRSVTLTISVGVAALDGERRELTDMLAAADAALYYAKETGRNKTHVIATRQAS
ncbi:MAG TPA: GGDEF domain-containing protein [Streptosporangiaceae bacterium]|nr:GGDEF domain-containing protein [Streptosporangiaceae bacterium]